MIHWFPISGHSYLPNDMDIEHVEKIKKKKETRWMQQFVGFTQWINIRNQYKPIDSNINKFSWLDIHDF